MEKFSSFERVIGNISETEKEQILRDKDDRFDDQIFEDLKGEEKEKTPEELQIISLANTATNEIRRKYGLKNFNIPPKNIHVISEMAWPAEKKGFALYNSLLQVIAIREQPVKMVFIKKISHELLHFKSYNALQITDGESPELGEYRVGLTLHTRDGQRRLFTNLNEAVTEEIIKNSAAKLFDNPLFAEEIKQTENIIARYPQAVANSGEPLFNNDVYYAEVEGEKSLSKAVSRLLDTQEKSKKITVEGFGYQAERKILNTLIDKILEKNPDKFKSSEEVFEIFAQGMMTGNILPVGRLIDKTFGIGTLRRIGELDQNIKEQENFVNSL